MKYEEVFKKKKSFPNLVCEICGYRNQLNFEPLYDWLRLIDVVCVNCHSWAYWSNYFTPDEIFHRRFELDRVYLLEIVAQRAYRLSYFNSFRTNI